MAAPIHDVIFLFGDSITQAGWGSGGFGHRLASVYARKLDVLNRGLSGYNTDWALPVFEQCFACKQDRGLIPKVRILTIWFGANDACMEPSPQHVPLPRFIENLKSLIRMVQSPESLRYSPDTQIILITPPPVNTYQRNADLASRSPPLALDRKFEITKAYAEAVKDVAIAEGVAVADMWTAFWDASGRNEQALSRFLLDGLHPNPLGYDIVYDTLVKVIAQKLPQLHYDKLQPVFPLWSEINWDDPASSLVKRNVD